MFMSIFEMLQKPHEATRSVSEYNKKFPSRFELLKQHTIKRVFITCWDLTQSAHTKRIDSLY
nr:hypothetical protein [uncultured archaeon]